MNLKHLAKIKKVLHEMQRSPHGRKAPTWARRETLELARPLSIPAHSASVKVGTARSIIKALLDDVAEWERYLNGRENGGKE